MKKTVWVVISYIAVGLICLIIGRATRKADVVTVEIPADSAVIEVAKLHNVTLKIIKDLQELDPVPLEELKNHQD